MNLQLTNYIKANLGKGYTKEELKEILKEHSWSELEIDESLEFISKSKPKLKKPVIVPPDLLRFVRLSLLKGIDKTKVRQALLQKGWPKPQVEEAFRIAEQQREAEPKKVVKKQEPIKKKPEKPKQKQRVGPPKKSPIGKILLYILAFIVVGAVIGGTVFLSFYIKALDENPQCPDAEPDCSLRDIAFKKAYGDLNLYLLAGGVFSLLFTVLHAIARKKDVIIWIANGIYLLMIIYIAYQWIMFSFY